MSVIYAVLNSTGTCIIAAILEGLFAGKNVKTFLGTLRTPAYAPPLWMWIIIAVGYYSICFMVLYRIFRFENSTSFKYLALILLLVVMAVNALWNYVFFQLQNLFFAFVLSLLYSIVAIFLFVCLVQFDRAAAFVLLPYLIYLVYAFYWGYSLSKLNPHTNGTSAV